LRLDARFWGTLQAQVLVEVFGGDACLNLVLLTGKQVLL